MNETTALIWLIGLPLVASPIIYLVGRIGARNGKQTQLARWLAFLVLLATGIPLYYAGEAFLAGGTIQFTTGAASVGSVGLNLRLDGISLLLAFTVLVLGALVTLFSTHYMANETGEEKYYALLTAMIGTMIGLGCAGDLFNLWVWFEAMAITSYMLVAFYRLQPASLEAGVKYLTQSATGSVLVLLGIALVFGVTGKLDLLEIRAAIQSPSPYLLAAGALFLIGFGVKTALVPLHTWLPDAHSQAPTGISAMLSGVVIETGLIAMLRSIGALSTSSTTWGTLLLGFGALNMLVGNLMALRQTQVKRLLAYSSLSHIGYMLVGLGVAIVFDQATSAAGGFFHLINHALMKGLAFLAAGALLYALHYAKGDHNPLVLEDLNGASRRYPVTAFALSVAVLGLGGLPPLAGFMSKWQIFAGGFQTQNTLVLALVIFAALNSVLSLAYYAPLVNRMYRHAPSEIVQSGAAISRTMGLPMVLLTMAIIILGIWPTLLSWITGPAAASLLKTFGG
jgi:proton-translocating NADH-quinone oxidoreductase chain N